MARWLFFIFNYFSLRTMASNEHQTVSTGNARLNQFKGFIGNTKEAKRANERRIYKPPLFRFHPNTKTSPYSYIVFKLHTITMPVQDHYYILFFTKRMLSTVTQISIAYQIVGTESVLVLNLQIELGRAPISSIIPNSK